MDGTLKAYLAKLEDTRQFIQGAEHVDALTDAVEGAGLRDRKGGALDERVHELVRAAATRRRFVYSAVVVALYGSFEAFVEDLIMAFLGELDLLCPAFEDLPESVRTRHIDVSAYLLLNRDIEKYRDRCDVDEVMRRMGRYGAGTEVRRINELAFTDHKSNFRAESLNDFFRDAGVPCLVQEIKKLERFRIFMTTYAGVEGLERLSNGVVLRDLDDVAQRRNEVAHGVPTDIWASNMMLSRVSFMQQVGECIFDVTKAVLRGYVLLHRCTRLPKPLAVHGGSIVCLHLELGRIAEGMRIIARTPDGTLKEGQIDRIEISGTQMPAVAAPPAVDVALKVGFRAKHNYEYFIVCPRPALVTDQ